MSIHRMRADAGHVLTCLCMAGLSHSLAAQQIATRQPVHVTAVNGRALGVVRAAVAAPRGRILMIGGPTGQELFLTDSVGSVVAPPAILTEIGAPLGAPATGAFLGENEFVIMDAQGPQWARVSFTRNKWRTDTVTSTDLSGNSGACAIGRHLFVMAKRGAIRGGSILHETDKAGNILRSFGERFGPIDNPATEYGLVLCVEDASQKSNTLAITTSRLYPELRAYAPDGTLRWRTMIPAFQAMEFSVNGRSVRFAYPPDSLWDQTVSLFSVGNGVAALQVGRQRGRNAAAAFASLRTILFETASGKVIASQTNLPMVVAATPTVLVSVKERTATAVDLLPFTYRAP